MSSSAESILVTGGCGLLGYHIVQALLKEGNGTRLTVVSRNPKTNIFDGVTYIAGDIGDAAFVDQVFTDVKPEVVFHTAAPRPIENVPVQEWNDTNVIGTKHLLEAARKSQYTKAFVFSSTVNVIQRNEHIDVKEDSYPYWNSTDNAIPYWRSKAQAEKAVLASDCESLKTVALRPCMIVGVQEHALIPAQLDALKQGKTNIQLGNNKNLFDVVSADNCADAHLLAMHALLDPSKAHGKVNGEAFNVTDGNPLPFWDVQRIIWRTAGDKTELKDVTVIPAWLARAMATISGLAYGILFSGSKSPELNQHVLNFCTLEHSYNIDKAKQILGYKPIKHTEETLRRATEWELEQRHSRRAEELSV